MQGFGTLEHRDVAQVVAASRGDGPGEPLGGFGVVGLALGNGGLGQAGQQRSAAVRARVLLEARGVGRVRLDGLLVPACAVQALDEQRRGLWPGGVVAVGDGGLRGFGGAGVVLLAEEQVHAQHVGIGAEGKPAACFEPVENAEGLGVLTHVVAGHGQAVACLVSGGGLVERAQGGLVLGRGFGVEAALQHGVCCA